MSFYLWKLINDQFFTYITRNKQTSVAPDIYQVDLRQFNEIARLRSHFKLHEKEMNYRATVPHNCDEPIDCEKANCFEFIPDKIIGE